MKISLELIVQEMARMIPEAQVTCSQGESTAEMALFDFMLLGTEAFRKEILVVVSPDKVFEPDAGLMKGIIDAGASLCIFDAPPRAVIEAQTPYISCVYRDKTAPDEFLFSQALKSLRTIFLKYENWQQAVIRAVQNCSYQQLLDVSVPIFDATFYLTGDDMEFIAVSGNSLKYIGDGVRMPPEIINYLKSDPGTVKALANRAAYLLPPGLLPARLNYNVFYNGTLAARLTVMDELHSREYSASELKLMDIVGEAVSIIRRQHRTGDDTAADRDNVSLITSILSGESVSHSCIESVLARNGWSASEEYSVGCLSTGGPSHGSGTTYYCDYIEKNFPGVIPIRWNGAVLLVIRGSAYATQNDFLSKFVPFMTARDLKLGLSVTSTDIQHAVYLARQAESALSHVMKAESERRCQSFSDCAVEYILQRGVSEMLPEMLCAEELLRLKRYDEANGSDYVTTLRCYLSNNMNAVATSKALFIHHATMVYRIKRLKEIGGIDFSNIDKLAHLVLSFHLMEMQPEGINKPKK